MLSILKKVEKESLRVRQKFQANIKIQSKVKIKFNQNHAIITIM